MESVFVYGTLMKGFGNNVLLDEAEFIGPRFMMFPGRMISYGGFPALVKSDSIVRVSGELYNVNTEIMERLDHLEGYPGFYDREIREVKTGEQAWVYYFKRHPEWEGEGSVFPADWRKYAKSRQYVR